MTSRPNYENCNYCGCFEECIMIERYYQSKSYLEKHGKAYVCNQCIRQLVSQRELSHDPHNNSLMFVADLQSQRKF